MATNRASEVYLRTDSGQVEDSCDWNVSRIGSLPDVFVKTCGVCTLRLGDTSRLKPVQQPGTNTGVRPAGTDFKQLVSHVSQPAALSL
ncbi:MAG: hypothetical protein DWI29_01295 [Planctomycetota bacterium]|nr:MAG: hypothetical protein DWI29_01295 [Planctomycetota bacterium]